MGVKIWPNIVFLRKALLGEILFFVKSVLRKCLSAFQNLWFQKQLMHHLNKNETKRREYEKNK